MFSLLVIVSSQFCDAKFEYFQALKYELKLLALATQQIHFPKRLSCQLYVLTPSGIRFNLMTRNHLNPSLQARNMTRKFLSQALEKKVLKPNVFSVSILAFKINFLELEPFVSEN